MSTHVITRRAYDIIQFVHSNKLPSKEDILNYLKDYKDFDISNRTLERDFERIETDFGIEIEYDKLNNGYFIDEEKSDKIDSFFRFLEIVTVTDIFNESLKDNKKILEYVSFDDSKSFQGIENIKPILLAISQKRKLLFKHHSYQKEIVKEYEIIPLKLKEYANRWYVLGMLDKKAKVWSFGIDRMSKLKLGNLYKKDKEVFEAKLEKYKNIIGVSFEDDDPKEKIKIELIVDEEHAKYLNSLPLHHSQYIHPFKVYDKFKVTYFLIPNYEFKTQILKMGRKAEILKPNDLREEIKGMLTSALDSYV